MTILRTILTIAAIAGSSTCLAAQESNLTGQFEVFDESAKALYRALADGDQSPIDRENAERLVQLILSDGKLSRRELGQIAELHRADQSKVFAIIDGEQLAIPTAGPEARYYFNLLIDRVPLAELWQGDAQLLRRFVDLREMSPGLAGNIESFVQLELFKVWKKSNINNGFAPIREVLRQKHDQAASLPGTYPEQFDELLYDSMIAIRDYYEERPTIDGPPPFIYNWLKPDRD